MIEYICRWCGEGAPADHDLDPADIFRAHRYCSGALVLLDSVRSAEDLLEDACRRESQRVRSSPSPGRVTP